MKRPIVIQQKNSTQRRLLSDIVDSSWPYIDVLEIETFQELKQVADHQRFECVFLELAPDIDNQAGWIEQSPDDVIGIINWKWNSAELEPYIAQGLFDFIVKPYQPARIERQLEFRRKFSNQREENRECAV
ncbi:MAG: hypothetical protein ABEJ65_12055 [bacterium]